MQTTQRFCVRSQITYLILFALILMIPPMTQAQSNPITPANHNPAQLQAAYEDWKADYVTSNQAGPAPRLRVVEPRAGNRTVSEGQAYGMLLAASFREQSVFDSLWMYAADHLDANGLMHWQTNGYQNITGYGAATDADVDIALALVMACQHVANGVWSAGQFDYCALASEMITAIWETEVDHPGPGPFAGLDDNPGYELIPGDLFYQKIDYPNGITNVSYFSPAHFRVFAEFTGNQGWYDVIDRNYEIARIVQANSCAGFVSNWNSYEGDVVYPGFYGNDSAAWGWDAARFAWRVALDRYWFGSTEAGEALNPIGSFFASVGVDNIRVEYNLDGTPINNYQNQFFTANGAVAVWAAPQISGVNCGAAGGSIRTSSGQAAFDAFMRQQKDNTYYSDSWYVLGMLLMTGNMQNPLEDGFTPPTPQPTDEPTAEPTQEPTEEETPLPPTPTDDPAENQPPTINGIGTQRSVIGESVNITVIASDPEGSVLRYDDNDSLPAGLSIGAADGVISGTVAPGATTSTVTITVTDDQGLQAETSFTWEIEEATTNPGTALVVELKSNGQDNNQQTHFSYRLRNDSGAAQSGISLRIYFTPDNGNAASNYVLEKYWDQSNSATVSGPTQSGGGNWFFTVRYSGTLQPGATWEYAGSIHLNNWAQTISTANDWWKQGGFGNQFAVTDNIPVYVNNVLVAGSEPSGGSPNPPPTQAPPTSAPPTSAPPTSAPPTSAPPTTVPGGGGLQVTLRSAGTDNNQQSQFHFRVVNQSNQPQSGLSVRIYFTVDNGNPASMYVMEKYWDQSGSANVSGPTQHNGDTWYFTVSYGGTLQPNSHWEYQGALRLSNWGQNYSSANDFWRSSGASQSYAPTSTIPVFQNGGLVWGSTP